MQRDPSTGKLPGDLLETMETDIPAEGCGRGKTLGASNRLPLGCGMLLLLTLIAASALAYYGTDSHLAVGYSPAQPVDFSHKLHAGDLGLDCRYCHSTVEESPFAAVPATESCIRCHAKVRVESVKLLPVRATYAQNQPIEWVRVHKLPDFAHFDHSIHLAVGVGCSTCHGRVDQMVRIEQRESLSMGWCLDCHRKPTPFLRKPTEITQMAWTVVLLASAPEARLVQRGRTLDPPTHCSGCHQ